MSSKENHTFVVWVDDNYHSMDSNERYKGGEFESYEEALEFCKKIVDGFLLDAVSKNPAITAEELYSGYKGYGEDPYIQASAGNSRSFSARDYAKERCQILCSANRPAQ